MISLIAHRRDLAAGARAMLPWLAGVTPFGLVIGVSAAHAGFPTLAGWSTGPLIYAGSAQIAAIQMLAAGAAPVTVVATVLVINVRLVLYSAAMRHHWRGTPLWWRLLGAYLLVDPSFVVGSDGYRRGGEPTRGHAHYLGGAAVLWVAWLVAIGVGATAGARLPAWLHLDFVIPLFLIGEVLSKLSTRASRWAALVAAAVAALAVAAPMHLGVAVAILSGIAAGLALPQRARVAAPSGKAAR